MKELAFAVPIDFEKGLKPDVTCEEEWYIFSGDQLLVHRDYKSLPNKPPLLVQHNLYMGMLDKKNLFGTEIEKPHDLPYEWVWSDLRSLYGVVSESQFALAGRALQLIDWERTNKYCGRCGSKTVHRSFERCLECPTCNQLSYPKLTPAIMVLVKREEKILLARGPHFPLKMYSALAGYVDPGETLEQCVAREVFEEVGIKICNIRYFGSQPWPFSRSLMIAFTCDWQSGEICADPAEIEDAGWFDAQHVPMLPPLFSISRVLIDSALS